MKKVLVSPGYGAGFGTWNDGTFRKQLVEDETLISLVEQGLHTVGSDHYEASEAFTTRANEIAKACTGKDENYVCLLGVCNLEVRTVHGPYFIKEYDGFESIGTREEFWD